MRPLITLVSCFYHVSSKHDIHLYISWIDNFISLVETFNLVIFTNQESIGYIDTKNNPKIKVILKPYEDFYTFQYQDFWIHNHQRNHSLKHRIDWKVNMIWNEKVWFVRETMEKGYFQTEYYAWCDIGYFRNRSCDVSTLQLKHWPRWSRILRLDKTKIHYGCVCDSTTIQNLSEIVNHKNSLGLPVDPIPKNQVSVAGNFFLLHKCKVKEWVESYYSKLKLYVEHDYLVKDDQIILVDCILSNQDAFELHYEYKRYDNWFMFQRIFFQ
jgi:Bacterial protein of unknown function (HtrL_YibB)